MRHRIPTMGRPPDHWRVERNRALFAVVDDRSVDGSEELLTVSHITGVSKRSEKSSVTMFMAESLDGYKRCRPGDLVINTMWAWMGALGVSDLAGIVSPAYHVYRVTNPAFEPRFFNYFYRTPAYVTEMTRNSRGVWTSRLRLYPEDFLDMESFVPPLAEQRAIADFLDRRTAAIDALISKKERLLELLAEQRAALIHRAVTRGLDPDVEMKDSGVEWIGEVPAHWTLEKLAHLLLDGPTNGVSPSVSEDRDALRSFSISAVRSGTLDVREDDVKRVAAEGVDSAKYSVRAKDIFLVRGNGNIQLVGRCGLARCAFPRFVYPDILMRMRVRVRVAAGFLTYSLNSPATRVQVEMAARTTVGTFKVNNQQVRDLRVLVPPLVEQVAIERFLAVELARANRLAANLDDQIDRLREYRQALITAAVTGQIARGEEAR